MPRFVKESASSLGSLNDLPWNDGQADNLRMRMLLRGARIGSVIFEDDDVAHSRIALKFCKAMPVRLENSLDVRSPKSRHQSIMPWTFNQHFVKTDPVDARFAAFEAARRTDLPLRRKHRELVDYGTEYPAIALASQPKAFFCRESFISGTEGTARQECCGLNLFPDRHKITAALGALRRDNH